MFSFVTGQSLSCIQINIIDDSMVESKETLSLTLQPLDSSPGVRISRGQSTVEIADNDEGVFINVMTFTLVNTWLKIIKFLHNIPPIWLIIG